MSNVVDVIKSEPAVVVQAVSAVLTLLVAFGFKLSAEQTAAIVAVVQIVAGFVIRSKVTPDVK